MLRRGPAQQLRCKETSPQTQPQASIRAAGDPGERNVRESQEGHRAPFWKRGIPRIPQYSALLFENFAEGVCGSACGWKCGPVVPLCP